MVIPFADDSEALDLDALIRAVTADIVAIVSTAADVETRLDKALAARDSQLIASLQRKLDRLDAREDALRKREAALRQKDADLRHERLLLLSKTTNAPSNDSAASTPAIQGTSSGIDPKVELIATPPTSPVLSKETVVQIVNEPLESDRTTTPAAEAIKKIDLAGSWVLVDSSSSARGINSPIEAENPSGLLQPSSDDPTSPDAAGSVEDLEYSPPPIGLRALRHGSLVHGPLPASPPPTSLVDGTSHSTVASLPLPSSSHSSSATAVSSEPAETSNAVEEDLQLVELDNVDLRLVLPTNDSIKPDSKSESLFAPNWTPLRSQLPALQKTPSSSKTPRIPVPSSMLRKKSSTVRTGPRPRTPSGVASSSSKIPTPSASPWTPPTIIRSTSMTPTISFSPDLSLIDPETGTPLVRPPLPLPLPPPKRPATPTTPTPDLNADDGHRRWNAMISYCWDDVSPTATTAGIDPRAIAHHLTENGISTYLDLERLDHRRASVIDQLVDAFLRSDVIILCVSNNWARSRICSREWRLIVQCRVAVVVVVVGDCRPNVWRRIASVALPAVPVVIANKVARGGERTILEEILREARWQVSRVRGGWSAENGSVFGLPFIGGAPATVRMQRVMNSGGVSGWPVMSRSLSAAASGNGPKAVRPTVVSPNPASAESAPTQELPGIRHLRHYAGKGNPQAQYLLGVLADAGMISTSPSTSPTQSGSLSKQDESQQHDPSRTSHTAFGFFAASAAAGYRDSMYRLAHMCERGRGCLVDFVRAEALYRAASSLGCPDSPAALLSMLTRNSPANSPPILTQQIRELLESAAAAGSIRATFKLAVAAHDADDLQLAIQLFHSAATLGDDPVAYFNAATLLERLGDDLSSAKDLYALSSSHHLDLEFEPGSAVVTAVAKASYNLGVFLERARVPNTTPDLPAAIQSYTIAANLGHVRAMYNLGVLCKRSAGDGITSVLWLTRAAAAGHVDAMFNLANAYRYGEGCEKSLQEAVRWYTNALEASVSRPVGSHVRAVFNLALCYEEGLGVPEDKTEAARLFKIGAECGDAPCQFYYGMALERGHGVSRDVNAATKMYRLAADQGDPDAASSLAHCYLHGVGFDAPDPIEAVRWFTVAARLGEPDAQHSLGVCLRRSLGVIKPDLEGALKWFRRAGRQGHIAAMLEAGECYESGIGTAKDLDLAGRWYARASRSGDRKGAEGVERIVRLRSVASL